jgi:hypothetical protein
VTHAIVLRLLEALEKKGHHIYMDNYYSSPLLYSEMKSLGYGACGTVRVDRKGMPSEWKGKQSTKGMQKGEVRHMMLNSGVQALQWKDKRVVTMLSTIHDTSMIQKTRRSRFSSFGQEVVTKPLVIDKYNTFMGGVDKSDQLLSYYGFSHRCVKWYKREGIVY